MDQILVYSSASSNASRLATVFYRESWIATFTFVGNKVLTVHWSPVQINRDRILIWPHCIHKMSVPSVCSWSVTTSFHIHIYLCRRSNIPAVKNHRLAERLFWLLRGRTDQLLNRNFTQTYTQPQNPDCLLVGQPRGCPILTFNKPGRKLLALTQRTDSICVCVYLVAVLYFQSVGCINFSEKSWKCMYALTDIFGSIQFGGDTHLSKKVRYN